MIVFGEDPPDQVLVDIHPECLGDLLRDSKAAKALERGEQAGGGDRDRKPE